MSFNTKVFYNSKRKKYSHKKSEIEILNDKIQNLEKKLRVLERENFNMRVKEWVYSEISEQRGKERVSLIRRYGIPYL